MSSPVGKLVVELVASVATFQSDLGKAAATAEQQARRIDRAIGDAKKQVLDFGKSIIGIGAGGFGAEKVAELFNSIKDKVSESERSINQLNAVLQATGNVAGLTVTQLNQIGKGVEKSSVFDVDQIRAAETALLRFRTVQKDVFGQAIALTPDLATALGTDLPAAAEILGKALTNPATGMRALRAAGLSLTEQQTDLAARMNEVGDKAGAQQIVIDALARSIGGAAEADTKGLYGASKRLTRSFGELEKAAGHKIFGDNHDGVEAVISALDRLVDKIERSKISIKELITEPGALAKAAADVTGFVARGARDAPAEPSRFASGKISGLPTGPSFDDVLVDLKAQAQQETEISDAAYSAQKVALQKRAENATSFFAQQLSAQKEYLQAQQTQLEFGYSRGTVTIEAFFENERKLAQNNANVLQVNLGKQGQIQEQLIASTGASPEQRATARARLQDIANKSDEAAAVARQRLIELANQETLALEKQADEYTLISAQLDEINGKSADAVKAQQEVSERFRRAQLNSIIATGDPVSAALAATELKNRDAIDQHAQAQARLNDLQEVYNRDIERLGIAQSIIDLQQQTGAISELSALSQKSALATTYIEILRKEVDAQKAVAEASGDPKLILAAQKADLQLRQLAATTDLVKQKLDNIVTDNVTNLLDDLVDHTKTVRQSFIDMATGIEKSILHLVNEDLSKQLYQSLFGAAGITGGVSPGNFLGNLLGFFTGGSTASASGASVYEFGGAASGTSSSPSGLMLVGERGPEILRLPAGSEITPNHEIGKFGRKNTTIHQTVVVNVPAGTPGPTANQIGRSAGQAVGTANRRFG